MKKKVVGVIPARWQSSRFPGKPLASILGKSLIQRTYENTSLCSRLDALVIATDDQRIFEHAQSFGADVVMTCSSCATGTDRVWQVIERHFDESEIIVNIQGDEPCLDPDIIDQLVTKLLETEEAALTTPVAPITESRLLLSPSVVKCVFDKKGRALYFSRSPIPFVHKEKTARAYYRHLGVYCFRKTTLREYATLEMTPLQRSEDIEPLKLLENGFSIYICQVEDQAIGVDTPEDIKTVENLLCQRENTYLSQEA